MANYLIVERNADYHFTVKANQKNLRSDIALHFENTTEEADDIQLGQG